MAPPINPGPSRDGLTIHLCAALVALRLASPGEARERAAQEARDQLVEAATPEAQLQGAGRALAPMARSTDVRLAMRLLKAELDRASAG